MQNNEKRLKLYLDWNIIADLHSGNLPDMERALFELKDNNAVLIPYSAEHIEEASKIKTGNKVKTKEEIESRLIYLSKLSSNLHFVNDMLSTGFKEEDPFFIYKKLNEVNFDVDVNKLFSNFVDYESLKNYREFLKLDSNILNNIKPEEAISKINELLTSNEMKKKLNKKHNGNLIFLGLLKRAFGISESAHMGHHYHNKISSKNTYVLMSFIIMLFIVLDSLGFWSDQKSTYERGSRFVDARHAFNGYFSDILISNDKRFSMKTQAVYSYLNCKTKVFHLRQEILKIKEILKMAI